jgi:hypothetical protein
LGFPEEHHILVIGIDFFVDIVVEGGIVEVDGAVLGKISVEEGIEFVEEFITETGVLLSGGVLNILFEQSFDFAVIVRFHFHEVNEAACSFDFRTDEDVL